MAYCSNCGEKVPENAKFCPKCGTTTQIGTNSGTSEPRDAMRLAFLNAGKEIEKAFSLAADEVRKAFDEARENIDKSRKTSKEARPVTISCAQCGSSNSSNAKFCNNCGKPLSKTSSST